MCWTLLASLLIASASAGDEFPVFPSSDDQEIPDIHGEIVVWQEFVSEYGDYDIYIADINNPDGPNLIHAGMDQEEAMGLLDENLPLDIVENEDLVAIGEAIVMALKPAP